MYLISGNITSNVTGNLLVITGNGNIGNITSNFRTLVMLMHQVCNLFFCLCISLCSIIELRPAFECTLNSDIFYLYYRLYRPATYGDAVNKQNVLLGLLKALFTRLCQQYTSTVQT